MNLPYAFLTIDPRTNQPRRLTPYEIDGTVPDPNNPGNLLPFNVSAATNPDGYARESVPIGGVGTIRLYGAAGFSEVTYNKTFTDQHGVTDELLLVPSGTPPQSGIHLEQRGNDFVGTDGQRIVFAGIDGFMDYRIWLDGGPDALRPFLEESRAHGFQVRRVFMMGSKSQNQVLELSPKEPRFYEQIRPFIEFENSFGQIPLLTVNVDAQIQMPNRDERIANWQRIATESDGTKRLMSGGNQHNKNGFDPWADIADPGHGVIWSRASATDDKITEPKGAPASELHATRESFDRALMDATASPPFMRKPENGGAGMVWMTEGNPFGDANGYTARQAWELGRGYSVLWSLAVFHNRQSQRGQLMLPETAACARQWVRGIQGLEYQP